VEPNVIAVQGRFALGDEPIRVLLVKVPQDLADLRTSEEFLLGTTQELHQ
jgi:hypothetical protein